MIPTEEICSSLNIPPNSVTKLKKACYGLVDAPLEWLLTVSDYLESIGFTRCVSDPCCFKYVVKDRLIGLISRHVDDFLFCGRENCATWKSLCVIKLGESFSGEHGRMTKLVLLNVECSYSDCRMGVLNFLKNSM